MAVDAAHSHPTTQVPTTGGGGEDAHAGHGPEVIPPDRNDPRFLPGTTGPVEEKGEAPDVKIPDGRGYEDVKGRKQNDDDKSKNNYSVTDANYNNTLGLLAKDPDTGKEMTYVQHIQSYNAAGYISAYAPEAYAELVKQQNAGNGTILGGALYLMGLTQTMDPAAANISKAAIPTTIPGTSFNAHDIVASGKDITGQNWARMHHAESSWVAFKSLVEAGVPPQDAAVFASDDAISGAGRVNGVNGQAGKDGWNDDERAIYVLAAQYQKATGIPVVNMMLKSHNHVGGDESALTNPKINKLIGYPKDARELNDARVGAIVNALTNGDVAIDDGTRKKLDKHVAKGRDEFAGLQSSNTLEYAHQMATAVMGASGGGETEGGGGADKSKAGGGHDMPMPPGTPPAGMGGCTCASDGVGQLGGPLPGDLAAVLQQLVAVMTQLVTAIQGIIGQVGAAGGGAEQGAPAPATAPADGAAPALAPTATATGGAQPMAPPATATGGGAPAAQDHGAHAGH